MNADSWAWCFRMIMQFPRNPRGSRRVSSFQMLVGVRPAPASHTNLMQASFCVQCPRTFPAESQCDSADKSNMSTVIFMYNHDSGSPRPGRPIWTPQNLIYDWQLIWSSQNTPAWPAERDSVGEKQRLPADSLAPSPSVYLPPYEPTRTPQKTH